VKRGGRRVGVKREGRGVGVKRGSRGAMMDKEAVERIIKGVTDR